jgi:phosphonate transport system substrate-binding protein
MRKETLFFLLATFCMLFTAPTVWGETQYVFGVHPYRKPVELKHMFTPLIKYLEKSIDAKISFRSATDYEGALNNLIEGRVDFSYLGSAGYAILNNQYPGKLQLGAVVLNNGKPYFQGVFVVKEESPYNSIGDLKGKKIAFGDRKSTLSCYMPAYMLIKAGIFDSVSTRFLGSHDNVALGILNGFFDGGGIKPGVAKKYKNKGLKIIATSEPVYEHVVVMGPNVDVTTANKVRTALLNVSDPVVYTSIKKSLTGFAAVEPHDYDNLKEIIKVVDAKMKK